MAEIEHSVNFGFASLLSATISMYYENFELTAWQLLLVFWAICLLSMAICAFGNTWLPHVDSKSMSPALLTIDSLTTQSFLCRLDGLVDHRDLDCAFGESGCWSPLGELCFVELRYFVLR